MPAITPLRTPMDIPLDDSTRALMDSLLCIAERAGDIVMGYYKDHDKARIAFKNDNSPVTAADRAAETFILGALNSLTPDIPVVSEEAAAAGECPVVGDLFWLVDPVDGTREFIAGSGEFTVNIGLIEQGKPVVGVVHAPARHLTWGGLTRGGLTWGGLTRVSTDLCIFFADNQPPRQAQVRPLPPDGATVVTSHRHGDKAALDQFLARRRVKETIPVGSSLKICLIAAGQADLYPRFGPTMEWDTAAADAVLRAAGGLLCDSDGDPLFYGKAGFRNGSFIAKGRADNQHGEGGDCDD